MEITHVLTNWHAWTTALFLTASLYAFLKVVVPINEEARRTMAAATMMGLATRDPGFLRAGAELAAGEWQKTKRVLLLISVLAGVGVALPLFALVGAIAAWPGWVFGAGGIVGFLLLIFSKY